MWDADCVIAEANIPDESVYLFEIEAELLGLTFREAVLQMLHEGRLKSRPSGEDMRRALDAMYEESILQAKQDKRRYRELRAKRNRTPAEEYELGELKLAIDTAKRRLSA